MSNPLPYKAPDGGRHQSEVHYLKGVIEDLRGTITGKNMIISDLVDLCKENGIDTIYEEGWSLEALKRTHDNEDKEIK